LNHRNGAQSVADRKLHMLGVVAATIRGEIIAPRPSAARAESVESRKPRKLRKSDVGLALLPRCGGLVGEVAEHTTVGGEI
jgi:hypothetical protein